VNLLELIRVLPPTSVERDWLLFEVVEVTTV